MSLVQEVSKDALRTLIFKLLGLMAKHDDMKFGEVRVSYTLVVREGKPAYLKCCDPHEHSIDAKVFRGNA
jgi:hypothetical protein